MLKAGLAAQPTSRSLRWLNAGEQELAGKIEVATALYEGLPDDALTQSHPGKLYQSMRRAADAVAQYDRAVTLAARSPTVAALSQTKEAAAERDNPKAELAAAKSP